MNNIIERTWKQGCMVGIEDMRGLTFQNEALAHTFKISGVDADGSAIALTGTPAGVMLRADNLDVALTCALSDGCVTASLPAECYDVPGRAEITIYLTEDGHKVCIYAAIVSVNRTSSGTASPGTAADVVDLVNLMQTSVDAAADSATAAAGSATSAAASAATASAAYNVNLLAPNFVQETPYPAGQHVIYDGGYYVLPNGHEADVTWANTSKTQQTVGGELTDLKSAITEQTRNLITGVIKSATMNGAGLISEELSNPYDFYCAPVESGKTYCITTDDASGLVCAFYNNVPSIGSTAYNSARIVQTAKSIVAPISGYIAFRTSQTYKKAQIEEGSESTEYIRPLTAIDAEAREIIGNAPVNAINDGKKALSPEEIIQNANIESDGLITSLSGRNLSVVYVGGASSVRISNGELYSFYIDKPSIGVKGTNRISMTGPVNATVPNGYNYIAVRSQPDFVPVIIPVGNVQSELKTLNDKIYRGDIVTGYISGAGIEEGGLISSLESRNVYYAPVYGLNKVYITKGELVAFYQYVPAVGVGAIAPRISISDGAIVDVPDGAYYIGIRVVSDTKVYAYHAEWIVDKNGNGDFITITEAVKNAFNGDRIFIRSGNYENEIIEAWGKEIHIVGEDKQTVVISNTLDVYATPPIEMDIGSIENVTVVAVKNAETANGAYAMHIEDDSEYGKTFTVRNCVFKAASQAAVGMGMRGNYSAIFENCDFIATDYIGSGTSGYAFYFHDTVDSNMTGADKVAFRNCRFYGMHTAGVVIRIDSNGLTGNTVEVEFVCNAIANPENNGSSNYLSLHNNGGENNDWKYLKGYSNSILSYGNQQKTVDYGM